MKKWRISIKGQAVSVDLSSSDPVGEMVTPTHECLSSRSGDLCSCCPAIPVSDRLPLSGGNHPSLIETFWKKLGLQTCNTPVTCHGVRPLLSSPFQGLLQLKELKERKVLITDLVALTLQPRSPCLHDGHEQSDPVLLSAPASPVEDEDYSHSAQMLRREIPPYQ